MFRGLKKWFKKRKAKKARRNNTHAEYENVPNSYEHKHDSSSTQSREKNSKNYTQTNSTARTGDRPENVRPATRAAAAPVTLSAAAVVSPPTSNSVYSTDTDSPSSPHDFNGALYPGARSMTSFDDSKLDNAMNQIHHHHVIDGELAPPSILDMDHPSSSGPRLQRAVSDPTSEAETAQARARARQLAADEEFAARLQREEYAAHAQGIFQAIAQIQPQRTPSSSASSSSSSSTSSSRRHSRRSRRSSSHRSTSSRRYGSPSGAPSTALDMHHVPAPRIVRISSSGRGSVIRLSDLAQLVHAAPRRRSARQVSSNDIQALPTYKYKARAKPVGTESDDSKGDKHDCMVCLCEFESGETLRILPCLHRYHRSCIDRWLLQHGTCPVCKHHIANR
jgi:Ring finger domain